MPCAPQSAAHSPKTPMTWIRQSMNRYADLLDDPHWSSSGSHEPTLTCGKAIFGQGERVCELSGLIHRRSYKRPHLTCGKALFEQGERGCEALTHVDSQKKLACGDSSSRDGGSGTPCTLSDFDNGSVEDLDTDEDVSSSGGCRSRPSTSPSIPEKTLVDDSDWESLRSAVGTFLVDLEQQLDTDTGSFSGGGLEEDGAIADAMSFLQGELVRLAEVSKVEA